MRGLFHDGSLPPVWSVAYSSASALRAAGTEFEQRDRVLGAGEACVHLKTATPLLGCCAGKVECLCADGQFGLFPGFFHSRVERENRVPSVDWVCAPRCLPQALAAGSLGISSLRTCRWLTAGACTDQQVSCASRQG